MAPHPVCRLPACVCLQLRSHLIFICCRRAAPTPLNAARLRFASARLVRVSGPERFVSVLSLLEFPSARFINAHSTTSARFVNAHSTASGRYRARGGPLRALRLLSHRLTPGASLASLRGLQAKLSTKRRLCFRSSLPLT